ncbi:hypothetical protein P7L70_23340 [Tistrella mobilis]|uniref:hypothetical protein n=1 Tax=Tistrella mobilis TaxID=171437 RepID=UPI003558B1CC
MITRRTSEKDMAMNQVRKPGGNQTMHFMAADGSSADHDAAQEITRAELRLAGYVVDMDRFRADLAASADMPDGAEVIGRSARPRR